MQKRVPTQEPQSQLPIFAELLGAEVALPSSAIRKSSFFNSESGSTAVEYAVMLGAICSVLLTSARALGNSSVATFQSFSAAISNSPDFSAPGSIKDAPDPAGAVSLPPGT